MRMNIFVVLSITLATCLAVARVTAQTGDFNADGLLDCQDIDLLNAEFLAPTGASQFDLNADGRLDYRDAERWREAAGSARGFGRLIPDADANLDGSTDHLDLNILALHADMEAAGWCEADFDGNGIAAHFDQDRIQVNWQQTAGRNVPSNHFAAPVNTPRLLPRWTFGLRMGFRSLKPSISN